jgi:hypothetical protein
MGLDARALNHDRNPVDGDRRDEVAGDGAAGRVHAYTKNGRHQGFSAMVAAVIVAAPVAVIPRSPPICQSTWGAVALMDASELRVIAPTDDAENVPWFVMLISPSAVTVTLPRVSMVRFPSGSIVTLNFSVWTVIVGCAAPEVSFHALSTECADKDSCPPVPILTYDPDGCQVSRDPSGAIVV